MRVFEIDQDMDEVSMSELEESFDDLARSSEDVCLDFSQVGLLDSAGIQGMVSLFRKLRQHSRKFAIVNVEGQPALFLFQMLADACVGPGWKQGLS